MLEIVADIIYNLPFVKLLVIFIIYLFYFRYVKRKKKIKPLDTLAFIIPILAARDLLFLVYMFLRAKYTVNIADGSFIIIISDILIFIIYLIWLRLYTGKRNTDKVFYILNLGKLLLVGMVRL